MLTYIPWLGSYGLLDPTDSFFLESGRELLEKNQYLLPLNNYVPWLDKPILFFWMVAGAYKCFGINPFIGRLPAALSAVATALVIYFACVPIIRPRTAALASLIFLAIPLSSIVGHVCLTDMTLCALISGSILFLFKGFALKHNRDLIIGYVFLAFAMLCKGPIAIILCGIALLPYLLTLSLPRDFKNADWLAVLSKLFAQIIEMKPLLGVAIILAVNLPWYIMASLATNGQFIYDFFIRQNFGRMMGTVNHQEPIYFYIPVFFGGFFPWCAFSLCAPGLFGESFASARQSNLRQLVLISVFWFASVIALFTAIKTKLPTYILPCAPAFSILLALQWEILFKARQTKSLIAITAFVALALLLAAGAVALSLLGGINIVSAMKVIQDGYIRDIIMQQSWILAPWAVSLVTAVIGLQKNNIKIYAVSFLSFALLTCGILVPSGLQISYQQKQLGFNELACRARDDNANVAMIFAEEPSVPWFTHKSVSRLSNREDAHRFLSSAQKPHYVLVQTGNLARLDWFDVKTRTVAEKGKWHLMCLD